MLKAGYNVKVSAGAVTAGGCLGILIPPSVLLIVYGATAGVSVVQLYAGAFFPGFMLAGLYIAYVIVLAKWKPELMPPLNESERHVPLPAYSESLAKRGRNALAGLWKATSGQAVPDAPRRTVAGQLVIALLPAISVLALLVVVFMLATAPAAKVDTSGMGFGDADIAAPAEQDTADGQLPPGALAEPADTQAQSSDLPLPPGAEEAATPEPKIEAAPAADAKAAASGPVSESAAIPDAPASDERLPVPIWYWATAGVCVVLLLALYAAWTWVRHEVFKMLLTSFFPLAVLILLVLGSIVFGLSTPTEAAAVGAFGGFLLAGAYRFVARWGDHRAAGALRITVETLKELGPILKDSSFLTAKTSAMVCWLFVGSAIFSAAFALLGGQELVEKWVLSLDMTPVQFMILAQFIIFVLGWPLEWTEIIVIFMPIFIPLLPHFNIDPLFFGLLVALNLQTAFLSPPVAMAAFYLKGVAPPHVTLNQIFAGMMPFMGIQVLALILLYVFPQIGLWLPSVVYGR
jgi:TRAP-type mannitol/chloroaromatic compound transport system permease large subunit